MNFIPVPKLYRWDRLFLFDVYIKKGSVGAEIGVFEGKFSKQLLNNGIAKLILIDPWLSRPDIKGTLYSDVSQNDMDTIYNTVHNKFLFDPRVSIIRGTSDDIPHIEYDWIYIDGDHRSESVYKDIINSWKLVKKCVILDDAEWEGVKTAVFHFYINFKNKEPFDIRLVNNQYILLKIN